MIHDRRRSKLQIIQHGKTISVSLGDADTGQAADISLTLYAPSYSELVLLHNQTFLFFSSSLT